MLAHSPTRQTLRRLCTLLPLLLTLVKDVADAAAQPARTLEPLNWNALLTTERAAPWVNAGKAWVSTDGKQVAFFVQEPSSAEGISRTLTIKDVDTDAVVFQKTLFSEEESLQHHDDLDELARSRAHEVLAARPQDRWAPLEHVDLSSHEREFFSDACFEKRLHPKRTAKLGAVRVTYEEPLLQIWNQNKTVLKRQVLEWRVMQQGCPHASPSWLKRVFIDSTRGVVLLELGFCGTDLCPEPATAFHALRLPSSTKRSAKAARTQPPVK